MVQNESWLLSHSNIDSQWIIDLNIEAKSRKWIEENLGDNLHGVRKRFLEKTQKAYTIKEEEIKPHKR